MTLRQRLDDHLAGTSALEDDEVVLRRGAELLLEIGEQVRAGHWPTLSDVVGADDPLAERFDEWRMNLVRNLAAAGLDDLAMETAELLRDVDPHNDVTHTVDLAVTMAEQGRRDDALRLARENTAVHPRDSQAWAGLVEVARVVGDEATAAAALTRAIEVADEDGEFGDVGELLARFDEPDDV